MHHGGAQRHHRGCACSNGSFEARGPGSGGCACKARPGCASGDRRQLLTHSSDYERPDGPLPGAGKLLYMHHGGAQRHHRGCAGSNRSFEAGGPGSGGRACKARPGCASGDRRQLAHCQSHCRAACHRECVRGVPAGRKSRQDQGLLSLMLVIFWLPFCRSLLLTVPPLSDFRWVEMTEA